MVTNQLEILPSSSMKALIALEMIRSERVGDLDTLEVLVVAQEVIPQAYSESSVLEQLPCRLVVCTTAWLLQVSCNPQLSWLINRFYSC